MYGSHVVTGKVIEYRRDSVLVQEGDSVSTYHLKYYRFPCAEAPCETDAPDTESPAPAQKPKTRSRFGQLLPFSR